jgi:hypothetical protein
LSREAFAEKGGPSSGKGAGPRSMSTLQRSAVVYDVRDNNTSAV